MDFKFNPFTENFCLTESTRVTALEDTYVRSQWYKQIDSGTSGTLVATTEIGTSAEFVADQWPDDVDMLVSVVTSGEKPDRFPPRDASGDPISATFNTSTGAWALSGTPNAYPVALIYCYRQKLGDFTDVKALVDFAYELPTDVGLIVREESGGVIANHVNTIKIPDNTLTDNGDNSVSIVIPHSITTGQTADDHHAKSHAHDGADGSGTVAHSDTTGQTTDDHHAQSHTIGSHNDTSAIGAELDTLTDGSNSDALHVHTDASVTVTHASTTGQTTDDHHAQSHTIASHNDTSATGAELDTLTDNSMADTLHRHSELVGSNGSPDPALSIDSSGDIAIGSGVSATNLVTVQRNQAALTAIDVTNTNTAGRSGIRLKTGAAEAGGLQLFGSSASGRPGTMLYYSGQNITNGMKFEADVGGLLFQVGFSPTINAMQILPSSYVGINQPTPLAQLHVKSISAATIGQIIQLAASHTASALEVRNSASTVMAAIDKEGSIKGKNRAKQYFFAGF